MQKAPVLLVAAVLALAGGAVVFWMGAEDGPRPPGLGPEQSAAKAPEAPPAPVAEADPFVAGPDDLDPRTPDLAVPGLAELRDEAPVDDAVAAESPRVLVTSGKAAAPVAGAEVLFVTVQDAMQRAGDRLPRRRIDWPEHCGQRVSTGDDGIAALPPTRHSWLAAARHDGEFAFAIVRPGRRTVTMALARDERVTIEVLTADGEAAPGVPLLVMQHTGRSNRSGRSIWSGDTGADGRAVVPHFQLSRRAVRGNANERFAAVARVATKAPILAEFDGRPAPEELIRLQLPPLAEVELLLTDHGDRPLLSPARVTITAIEPVEDEFPGASRLASRRLEKPTGAAPLRFPWLAAGSRLRAATRFPGERREAVGEPFDLPQEPGELLSLQMQLPQQFGLFAGQLVLDTGEALGDRELSGVLWDGDKTAGNVRIHTTAAGFFDVVQRPRKEQSLMLEIHTHLGEGPARRLVGCRVRMQPPAAGRRVELGEVVLGELPTLCSGIVVDDRGQPVAAAAVVARKKSAGGDNRRTFDLSGLEGAQLEMIRNRLRSRNDGGLWRNVPLLRTVTDAAGRFELLGTFPGGELEVRADTDEHLAQSVPWLGVGQNLQITIARNGVLRGRAVLPDDLPRECASLILQPQDETARRRGTVTVELSQRRGGRFVVEPLRAGRYDAIVRLRSVPEPVLTIPDVFITPGECADHRMAVIDLRQSVFYYELRAVDYGGNPMTIDSALVMRWKRQDGKVENAALRWQKGRAEFFAGSALVDLVSFAPGCEPLEVQLSPGRQDVAMKRLVPAQLLLPGARQLCGPDRKVRVSVILIGDSGYPQWLNGRDQRTGRQFSFQRWELGKSTGAWLESSDLVDVPIVKSGKYQVVLRVHATMSERSQQVSVNLGEFELKVDGSKLTPVTVPIDAQKVQAALARLKPPEERANGRARGRGR